MGLLNKQTSDLSSAEWAAVWLRYHREQRDEDFWAVDAVFLLPQDDPEASIWLNRWHQDPGVISRLVAASGDQIEPFELDHDQAERDELQGKGG